MRTSEAMLLKVFWKQNCPRCPQAKAIAKELEAAGSKVEYHDVDELEGLTVATLYGVMATPSLVVVNDKNDEAASWRGEVPALEDLKKHFP